MPEPQVRDLVLFEVSESGGQCWRRNYGGGVHKGNKAGENKVIFTSMLGSIP